MTMRLHHTAAKRFPKSILSAAMALGLLLSPALALADGTIQLKPLQPDYSSNVYNSNSSYGIPSYGNSYYTPESSTMLRGRLISIPKGTLMSVHMGQSISTYGAHIGDPITATLENDVFVNDSVAIPAGSQVLGQVANVSPAGHLGKHGEVDVRFDSVKLPDGRVVPVQAHVVTKDESGVLKGDTYMMDVAKGVGVAAGATGVGTLMGTAAGSLLGSVGTGAVFGLGVGALGGMGYALARKGKEVTVPAGSRMSIVIDSPVTMNF
ncbi:MAG TPA: hypothetical protein V6C52_15255 [Coleofasciculaceae cyanobacterium]|jgi:hypothetical protein